MLVSAKDVLERTREDRYTVGQFNINSLEWTKPMLLITEELESPVILGVSEDAGKYMTGFKTVTAMIRAVMEELNITIPVALHLDHGTYDGCYKCIKAEFSSIVLDGSHYPIEENTEKTKELVKVAHAMNLSLGAGVGSIGGERDDMVGLGGCVDPRECKAIVDPGIDFLVADIGSIHGKYPKSWPGLRFDVSKQARAAVDDMPLVLHGDTGTPEDIIKKVVSLGVAKISVNTECQLSSAAATREYIEAGRDLKGKGFDPRKLLTPGADAVMATIREKMELFSSVDKT